MQVLGLESKIFVINILASSENQGGEVNPLSNILKNKAIVLLASYGK